MIVSKLQTGCSQGIRNRSANQNHGIVLGNRGILSGNADGYSAASEDTDGQRVGYFLCRGKRQNIVIPQDDISHVQEFLDAFTGSVFNGDFPAIGYNGDHRGEHSGILSDCGFFTGRHSGISAAAEQRKSEHQGEQNGGNFNSCRFHRHIHS